MSMFTFLVCVGAPLPPVLLPFWAIYYRQELYLSTFERLCRKGKEVCLGRQHQWQHGALLYYMDNMLER